MADPNTLAAMREMARRELARRQEGQPAQSQVIGTFADNGRILRAPDGSLQAVSRGGASNDPATIERIMAGDSFAAVMQGNIDQDRIAANPVAARVNEFNRGAPFVGSYLDEAVGMVSPQARDNMRATSEAMQRQNPGQTAALNLAGGVAGSIPAAIAAGPTIMARAPASALGKATAGLGAGAVAAGTEGAVYGYGEGANPEDRQRRAMVGGGVGAAAGGALGFLAPYAGQAAKWAMTNLRGSDVSQISKAFGISNEAAIQLRNALDGEDLAAAEAAIRTAGPEAMLADAGEAGQSLLDASIQSGGQAARVARTAVDGRTTRSARMMTEALDETLGAPRGIQEMTDEIRTGTAGARSSAYDAAYAQPIDYSSSEGRAIESLFRRVPKRAWSRAQDLMDLEGVESAQRLVTVGDNGQIIRTDVMPDVRQIDYLTRALNDVAAEADGAGKLGGTTDVGRATGNLSRQLRQLTRRAVPEYGQALDTAADAISERNAVEFGANLFRQNTRRDEVARQLAGASRAEREAMKQGLRSHIDDTLATVTRTMTDGNVEAREGQRLLRDMSSRANKVKLRQVLGQEEADALFAKIDEAAASFEVRSNISNNSLSARRIGIQQGVRDTASGGALRTLMAGEPIDATKRVVQALTGETVEARQAREAGIFTEIADVLTQTRGPRAQSALAIITSAIDREAALSASQARLVADVLSTSVLSGSQATSQALGQR